MISSLHTLEKCAGSTVISIMSKGNSAPTEIITQIFLDIKIETPIVSFHVYQSVLEAGAQEI